MLLLGISSRAIGDEMLDASGKVASGLLVGTIGDLGNFDECLATTVENMYGERDFTGRFCTVYMNFKNNTFVAKMVARFQEKGYLRCLGHLWYINIDFQLYVALLFIPLVMIRRPYLGALFAALATVVSSAYTGVVSYLNNYQPAVIFTHTDVSYTIGTANQIYFKPFAHVGSFCIGVLLGYYIYVAPKMKLSKVDANVLSASGVNMSPLTKRSTFAALLCTALVLGAAAEESATRSYEADLRDIAQVVIKKFFPIVSELVTSPELSVDCSTSLLKTFSALRQQKGWAYR
ncbi:hypothetical protein V5799_029586, partial [Amblyomma americanum]